jgi:type VI secretion system protein ImpL
MVVYIVIGVILLIYLVLVGLLGSFFPVESHKWIFRVVFWIFGLVGAGVFVWIHAKRQRRRKKREGELSVEDIDLLARDAEARIAAGRMARDPKLAHLPALLVVGEAGASKTSTVVHCGAEPQLLSGQVYQDTSIAPTRLANFWFAADTVVIEAGSALLSDSDAWERLIRRLRPSRMRATFGGSEQSPRALLFCIDCETLAQPQAQDKLAATARLARERLGQAARLLGIDLPVYVLFTKLDRLPAFADYARNFSNEEAGAIVGETLPVRRAKSSGVYAEEETARLTEAFHSVYFELCDKRLMLLAREQQEAKLPGTYEFPREFGKLRGTIVRFLVDLCRPSQLDFGPFLRGFYFSGVRPVLVTEGTGRTAPSIEQAAAEYGEATRLFGSMGSGGQAAPSYGGGQTRKVPQWAFVTRLFNEVLLRDPTAATASSYSRSSHLPKRLLLGAITSILLICIIGFTVSYLNNSDFEERNLAAARALARIAPQPGDLPSIEALTQLDTLRQSLEEIHQHRLEGRPWSRRWGLYVGEKVYDSLYRTYFDRFRALLLNDSQNGVMSDLQQLPAQPPTGGDDAAEQQRVYSKLAAYLITTDIHQCSSREAVARVLFVRWPSGRVPSEPQANLASAQFDFYADMLRERNPYETPSNGPAVEKGRRYLSQMQAIDREYLGMITEASAQVKSVNFNRDFPGSEALVRNGKEVPGAFTKQGWAFIQPRIANRGAAGEGGSCDALIMGPFAGSGASGADAGQQLLARYSQDFLKQWLDYLQQTRVAPYASARDAAVKLERFGSPQSPLLANLWLASDHAAGGPPEVAEMFQPPQFFVPPGDQGFVADSNKGYLSDLFTLQDGWNRLAQSPQGVKDKAIVDSLLASTTTAKANANQAALGFRGDTQGQVSSATRAIILAPIENSERLLQRLGPLDLNNQGKGLCSQISLLKRKYPFNPSSAEDASLQELAAVFHPQQGSLWALYAGNLQELLIEQGGHYAAKPGGSIQLNPAFVGFFNQAAAISRAFYPEGATEPRFVYTVTPQPIDTLSRLQLRIDGQLLSSGEGGGKPQQVLWPNDGSGSFLYGAIGGGNVIEVVRYTGPWSVFRFFASASRIPPTGSGDYEWRPTTSGQPMVVNGKVVIVRYNLNHGANPPILKPGYLSTLSCPASVTR